MRIAKLLFLLLLCPMLAFGQGAIATKVQKAATKQAAETFSLATNYQTNLAAEDIPAAQISEGVLFTPDARGIADLQIAAPDVLQLSFDLPGVGATAMTLIPNRTLAEDFVLRNGAGEILDYSPGLYYYGILNNDPTAIVALSVFNDELHGMISTTNGNFVIAKLTSESAAGTHIIYNDLNYSDPDELDCGTRDDGIVYTDEELAPLPVGEQPGDCIRVYVEVDDDIVSQKGGATNAANYVTGVFNESITLYANDGLAMVVSEMKVWDTPAPYSGSSSSAMLNSFQANTGAFNGDLAHLVSYQASGGIAAGFSGICNSNVDNSKCFSSISSSYSVVPNYSFTVMVVTHEMGHLIGSRHTHACVWNGNGTAIDGCSGQTEGSCPLPGNPSNGGTIMSYCHLATGIDFTQGFGPQPGNVIRNTINNSTCTSACGPVGPTCFDGVQNGQETGVDCGGPDCPSCPEPCLDNEVTITINTDNYGSETTWTLTNASGTVLASGGPYANNSTYTQTVCIVGGCYDFQINDSYGDGICCAYGSGSYSVTSGGITYASGGQFTFSETTNFCLGGGPAPTCSDGIQNQGEQGVDCGGPCTACPTCNDGIQNQGEQGVDCGGPCTPCPTCFDGIQNGQETGVDCGGPDCAPCGGGGSTEILGSFFETGWDGWLDGGGDCFRYSGSFSYEGNFSIRIRDNSGTASSMTTASAYNLTSYSAVEVEFFFYMNSMENGEDFWLRVNNGSGWQTIGVWTSGNGVSNNTFYTTTVTVPAALMGSNTQFRFQCDASANGDQVYIDAVTITGLSGTLLETNEPVVTTTELGTTAEPANDLEVLGLQSSEVEVLSNEVKLFPNPATDQLQVRSAQNMQSIRLVSATGQVIRTLRLDANQSTVNVSDLKAGVYYLMVEVNGELRPQRFVKQ